MRRPRIPFNLVLSLLMLVPGPALRAADAPPTPAEPQATTGDKAKDDAKSSKKKKKHKPSSHLRIHIEAKRDLAERSMPAAVGRSSPLAYNVEKMPILTELHVENLVLMDQPGGGLQLQVKFNSLGTKLLESYTAAAAGKHLLILTDFDEQPRWLAAPLIRQRIPDGVLLFSPDASREELERLVRDVNEAIRKEKKQWLY